MSLLNNIIVLGTIGSYIGDVGFDKSHKETLKKMRKHMNHSFMNKLPDFHPDKKYIIASGRKINAGSIIKRPLQSKLLQKLEFHYAVVLGHTIDGKQLAIDMTNEDGKNIRLVDINEFMAGYHISELKIYFNSINSKVTQENVIERAKKIEFEIYDLWDLNCKDFAYYCVTGKEPEKRSIKVLQGILHGNAIAIQGLKLMLNSAKTKSEKDYYTSQIAKLEEHKINITKKISALSPLNSTPMAK